MYITDNLYQPLAAIGRDGNIYALGKDVTLGYGYQDGYMLISVLSVGTPVAKVWYKIDFFYTAK